MVAYSFQKQFAEDVAQGKKRQTIRALRKRHAKIGEPLQLYTGMRTRSCRKLVAVDPVCTRIDQIEITLSDLISAKITTIVINGIPLDRDQIEAFAKADGFKSCKLGWSARHSMGRFFYSNYGLGIFRGVVIHW